MFPFSSSIYLLGLSFFVCMLPVAAQGERSSDKLPSSVDLRPTMKKWGLETRCQGARGTCSVFALTGALEYAVASKQKHGTLLSIEFLNWAGHKVANRTADGGFFSELWQGFETYGVCTEETLPYQSSFDSGLQPDEDIQKESRKLLPRKLKLHWIKEWDVKTGLSEKQVEEIKRVLSRKWPVCGGLRWPKREQWNEGVLQMCSPEAVFDGHSILIVGYRDDPKEEGRGVFLIRNSGGSSRDGCLPYAYVRAYMNDAAWIQ